MFFYVRISTNLDYKRYMWQYGEMYGRIGISCIRSRDKNNEGNIVGVSGEFPRHTMSQRNIHPNILVSETVLFLLSGVVLLSGRLGVFVAVL